MENKRLKILIVSDTIPYPLSSGGRVCTFNFIDYLRTQHDFTLIAPSHSEETQENKKTLQKLWPNVTIECVDLSNSNKISFAARVIDFIKRKLDVLQNKIENKTDTEYSRKLNFTAPFEPLDERFVVQLKNICEKEKFDIIQVQYTHYLNLVEVLPKNSIKIYEHIESQFDVLKDFAKNTKLDGNYADYLVSNLESLENFYINKYDAVFTLNQNDCDYLKHNTTFPKIVNSPFGVLTKDFAQNIDFSSVPNKIVFSGGEAHYPNVDALEWYLSKIHSAVVKEFGLNLHITGKWSEETKNHLKSISSNIIFEGFVDDLSDLLKQSIVIVPIRIGGGGLRTKILYAMANGAPVISTKIGAFGIEANSNDLLLADTENELIDSFRKIMSDGALKEKMTKNAFELVSEKYSQKSTSELRNKEYLRFYS